MGRFLDRPTAGLFWVFCRGLRNEPTVESWLHQGYAGDIEDHSFMRHHRVLLDDGVLCYHVLQMKSLQQLIETDDTILEMDSQKRRFQMIFGFVSRHALLVLLLLLSVAGWLCVWLAAHLLPAETVAATLGHVFHAVGGKLLTLAAAVGAWCLIDKVWLKELRIVDVIFGRGQWSKTGDDIVRAATIRAWFLAFAAWVLAFSFGGAN